MYIYKPAVATVLLTTLTITLNTISVQAGREHHPQNEQHGDPPILDDIIDNTIPIIDDNINTPIIDDTIPIIDDNINTNGSMEYNPTPQGFSTGQCLNTLYQVNHPDSTLTCEGRNTHGLGTGGKFWKRIQLKAPLTCIDGRRLLIEELNMESVFKVSMNDFAVSYTYYYKKLRSRVKRVKTIMRHIISRAET